jgi:hypothetical protein
MRDIRDDLQERAKLLEEQINAAPAQFENLIVQLQGEHDSSLGDLKAELEAVKRIMEIEHRRLGSASFARKPQPQQALATFLIRKLSEVGPTSRRDLCRLAVQEGYFADSETAEQAVHATLMHVAKSGHIQQLPNSNFAPTMVRT